MTKIFSEMLLLLQLHILLGLRQLCRLQRDEHNTLSCCLAYPARPSRCHLMILLHVNVTGNQKITALFYFAKGKIKAFTPSWRRRRRRRRRRGRGRSRGRLVNANVTEYEKTALVLYFFKRKNQSFYTELAAAAAAAAATGAGAEPREACGRKRHRKLKKQR